MAPSGLRPAREDLTGTLETFASEKDRLVNVVPGKGDYGSDRGIEGIRASWLVFETLDEEEHTDQRYGASREGEQTNGGASA